MFQKELTKKSGDKKTQSLIWIFFFEMIDFTSRLQICPYSFGNSPPQMVPRDLKYWFPPGFGGLIQGQIYNPCYFGV